MATYTATSKAADAPDVSGLVGMVDLRLTDEPSVAHGIKGQYAKDKVNGDDKFEWPFIIIDDEGDPVYIEGEEVEVTTLTGMGFNIASKTVPGEVKMLKALLTASEFAAFENGEGTNGATLPGRVVQAELFVKENGWPGISNVIKASKATLAREAKRAAKAASTASTVDED
jgi:hypothetical protein